MNISIYVGFFSIISSYFGSIAFICGYFNLFLVYGSKEQQDNNQSEGQIVLYSKEIKGYYGLSTTHVKYGFDVS